jgi:lipoic acid synthetase
MDMRKPDWLRAKLPTSPEYKAVREIVDNNDLHTVCKSAQCPNMGECWSRGTATVMILGNICTRSCTFVLSRQVDRLNSILVSPPA